MCVFTRNGFLQDVTAVECIQVFPGYKDNIVATAQLVVNYLLPKRTEGHNCMYNTILAAQ